MPGTRIACLVFAKPPRPGAVKTRLAADIGPEAAAAIAAALLADTVERLLSHDALQVVISTPEPAADHGPDLARWAVPRWDQGGGELGERLERGFARALREHPAAIALGADTPGIPEGHVAFLRDHARDAPVLGPTDDGGFWALLLDRCPEGLLLGLPWSTPQTASATRARLSERLRPPLPAPGWWDVDTLADLHRLRREIDRTDAPRAHAALDALGGFDSPEEAP